MGYLGYVEINEVSFEYPPSPLLSQRNDVLDSAICNGTTKPTKCKDSTACSCIYMYSVPKNSVVEIVLLDVIGQYNVSHAFHLHGGVFQVVGFGNFLDKPEVQLTPERFQQFEREGLIKRNYDLPLYKDTVVVPYKGYLIIRSRFSNVGYWFFHCHFVYHMMIGMNILIQVGNQKEMPVVPKNFPKCGNFEFGINSDPTKI